MELRTSSRLAARWPSRLFVIVGLLLIALGANADDCPTLYARSGAIPETQTCRLDVAGNTPGGMGNYACINDVALIDQWCSVPDAEKPEKSCPVADPVYPGSGAVALSETDFVSGDDAPMVFERTYRSAPFIRPGAEMGAMWFHNWQRQLNLANARSGSAQIIAYRKDGEPLTFNKMNGIWRTAEYSGISLVEMTSGWTLTDLTTDTAETYSAQGVLLSEHTHDGQTTTLTYSDANTAKDIAPVVGLLVAVTRHADGYSSATDLRLRFVYDAKRRLTQMEAPGGAVTHYTYDENSNLISVTWPDGNVRRYLYEDFRFSSALTGVVDEAGSRVATWTYDERGRAIAVSHPDTTRNVQFAYRTGATTLTYGQRSLIMNFVSNGRMLRPTGTSSVSGSTSTTWDTSGSLLSQTGVDGSSTAQSYDVIGRPTRTVVHDASGTSVTSVRYADSTSLRPSTIASPGWVRAVVYDANGNATGISELPTNDPTGEKGFDASTSAGQQRTYGLTYDSQNKLSMAIAYVNGEQTEFWISTFNFDGNRRSWSDRQSSRASYVISRDVAHRPLIFSGEGFNGSASYDMRGRVTAFSYTEAASPLNGNVKRLLKVAYRYSADGRVTSRSGTVSTNNDADTSIGRGDIDTWLGNAEAGIMPAAPPIDRTNRLRALPAAQEAGLEAVCVECVVYAGPRFAWTAFQVLRDPVWAQIKNGIKPAEEAKQCVEIPPQLTAGERAGMLRELFNQKGDTRMGSATRTDSDALAKDFIGPGYRETRDRSGWVSADGLRVYRFAKPKNSPYAETGIQSNFQVKTTPRGEAYVNGHLNILP